MLNLTKDEIFAWINNLYINVYLTNEFFRQKIMQLGGVEDPLVFETLQNLTKMISVDNKLLSIMEPLFNDCYEDNLNYFYDLV